MIVHMLALALKVSHVMSHILLGLVLVLNICCPLAFAGCCSVRAELTWPRSS